MQISRKEWIQLGLIFVIALIFYSITALKMGNIVFYPGDENRFLALAKSIHFSGNISEHYMIKNYDDVLYPFLLSLGYFFYSPEHILDIFRCIGVILMTSAVFPTYFLARKMEIGKIFKVDGAIFVTVLSMLIPEMTYTMYLMEEVLLYPLFMWMLYLVYLEFADKQKISRINIPAMIVFFLIYTAKTFAVVFAAVYCLTVFLYGILIRDKKLILKSIFSGCIFLFLVVVLKGILFMMNGMQMGYSHYDAQVLAIFPFTMQVFVGLIRGLLFYSGWFILFTGIVPFLVLCSNFKNFEKKDILWAANLLGLIILTIFEIVVIIHYSEEGTNVEISRFHYRYLFYFFIPMLMILIKYKHIGSKKIAYSIVMFELIVLNVFFVTVNSKGQGICDGIMCLFFRRINNYQGGTDTIYTVLLILLVGIILLLIYDKNDKIIYGSVSVTIALILIIMPLSLKMPIENSAYTEKYIDDYIKVAKYINENSAKVLCVSAGDYSDPVLRTAAYNTKDFLEIFLTDETEKIEIDNDRTVILMSGSFPYGLEGNVEEIHLGTENMRVYLAQKGILSINKNEYNIDFSSYGFVTDGYDESGKRYLLSNGISFGPYTDLARGKYQIEVLGQNLTGSNMFSYSGADTFEQTIKEAADDKVVLEIELLQDISNFEFSVRNMGEAVVIIDNIKIKKLD